MRAFPGSGFPFPVEALCYKTGNGKPEPGNLAWQISLQSIARFRIYRLILRPTSVRISPMDAAIISRIALETAIPESSVAATVALFEKGATGPFIVHYRKEATGGLDEGKIRSIQERMAHYREVWDQRAALLKFLSEQGKLTDELRAKIESCFSKAELDDLHHQFRPRRKTRAAEASEKGLEPLAEYFWNQESDAWSVEQHIDVFVDPAKGVSTREQALQGVVDIIAERIWANFEYRKALRDMLWSEGALISSVVPAKVGQKTKYTMYYERREAVSTIPSHRVLAIRRGCKEGILISSIESDNSKALEFLLSSTIKDKESIFAPVLEAAVRECYSRILRPLIETEVRTQLKERADREAIKVFQENLANLLLSPPAGPIVVMGVDWGKGDECSVAVVNEAGRFVEGAKIRLIGNSKANPRKASQESGATAPELESAQTKPHPVDELTAELPPDVAAFAGDALREPSLADAPSTDATLADAIPVNDAAIETIPEEAASPDIVPVDIAPTDSPPLDAAPAFVDRAAVAQADAVPTNDVEETQVIAGLPAADSAAVIDVPSVEALVVSTPTLAVPASEIDEKDIPGGVETEDPRKALRDLITRHNVHAISIGAGTGARELETAFRQIVLEEGFNNVLIATVNDAGMAIYSSSRIAREEFPEWSASARCAVSLARRLQDPLAELAKIDPKLIGVGQYQHDVDQKELHRGLLQTVQFCVNKVGVNVNTAGESLLRYVSGLNDKYARRIVAGWAAQGQFRSRAAMKSAVGMDDATYMLCAAFLRIPDGDNPLDRTAVHPESYPIVEKMASALGVGINDLIGNKELISSLKLEEFVSESIGIPTLNDIREELLRPGRDPRKTFRIPKFRADVKEMSDLKPGMNLEGTVTNVTNFGAFVDIGVRQDGLVHLSQMSNRFIRDPREAVRVGDVVEVKVISVEPETKRIGLSMKALSSNAQRRRKRQQRRGLKPSMPARQSERAQGETTGSGSNSDPLPAAADRVSHAEAPPRSKRPYEGPARQRRRSFRKPEGFEETRQQKEPSPKEPEPTLQEKIAILQSKFRGIN
jgi:protein Tex